MQKIIKITNILLIIFILSIFYFALNKNSNYETKNLIGNKLNNISLKSFKNDKIYTNEDFKNNKYMLINFWASWCAPCRVEHPYLMELSKEHGLKILGVNFKDKKVNAVKFLNDLGNPYDYLTKDSLGKNSVNFGIYGIPESILIDSQFKIIKKIIGQLNNKELDEIREIIKS